MTVDRTLEPVVEWIDKVGSEVATTLARFAINLDDFPIWPVWGDDETDLEIFVDDILASLTDQWGALLLEEVYPQGLSPARPSELMACAEIAAASGPRNALREELMSDVLAFTRAHDLSRWFGGLYDLPALWLMRQGTDVLIETANRQEKVPLESWLRFATSLGDLIATRLRESDAAKWKSLVDAWEARDRGDPIKIASLSTGHSKLIARKLLEEELLPQTSSVREAANDNGGLRVAARMMGSIPYQAIRTVLKAAADVPHRPSAELDALREELSFAMRALPESAYPYEQGVFAANWIRQHFSINPSSRCDPVQILAQLNVAISYQPFGPATLDALAIWGDAHGPGVIFNTNSRKLSSADQNLKRRPMLNSAAHELCHLVLDYRRTIAAVDILGSRMPADAERRANAFAAEFMLPAKTAYAMWRESELQQTREGLSKMLGRLSDRFDVSRTVAGWQLDHGLEGTNPEIVFLLDELLDRR
jgi:hypothetical protein